MVAVPLILASESLKRLELAPPRLHLNRIELGTRLQDGGARRRKGKSKTSPARMRDSRMGPCDAASESAKDSPARNPILKIRPIGRRPDDGFRRREFAACARSASGHRQRSLARPLPMASGFSIRISSVPLEKRTTIRHSSHSLGIRGSISSSSPTLLIPRMSFDTQPPRPGCGTGIPGPTAAPHVRWRAVNIRSNHIRLDRVTQTASSRVAAWEMGLM